MSAPPAAVGDRLDARLAAHAVARPDATALVVPRGPAALDATPAGSRRVSFAALAARVGSVAAALRRAGIGRGTRTALLVGPGEDFVALGYALLRLGAVPVLVDPGIGARRVRGCLARAGIEAFVGVPRAHLARRALGWAPDATIAVTTGAVPLPGTVPLRALERLIRDDVPPRPDPSRPADTAPADLPPDPAAVLFTSGSTGPPKGVAYRHEQLLAQADLLAALYDLGPDDTCLATFPPFALFGPALGMTTVLPRMDPTRPAAASPARLVRAARRDRATVLFASPALLDTLVRGAPAGVRLPDLRRVVSAGAPVPRTTQRRVLALLGPGAQVHTPYGATEALPVTSIGSDELLALDEDGICVGRPVPGVDVAVLRRVDGPLERLSDDLRVAPGEIGEVVVRGPVVSRAYDADPAATAAAKLDWDGETAHRTGDVASVDDAGRLWFAGRVAHVVDTPDGPRYSVPVEVLIDRVPGVRRSALVGVAGRPVLVVEPEPGAGPGLVETVRAHAAADPRTSDVVAVLRHRRLPVDPRHNAKIDRGALARWAAGRCPPSDGPAPDGETR